MRAIDDLTQTITLGLAAAPTSAVQYVGTYAAVDGVAVGIAGTLPDTNSVAINYDAKRRMLQPGRVTQLTISNPAGNSSAAVTVTWRDDGPDPDEVIAAVVHQATIAAGGSAKYTEGIGWQLFTAGGLVQGSDDWYAAVAKGLIPGHSLVHRFGRNPICGTGGEDINLISTISWLTAAGTIEVLSGSGNDTAAGTGARKVTVEGLSSAYASLTEEITMSGVTPVSSVGSFFRVHVVYVSEVGTYHGNNAAQITTRVSGGGTSLCFMSSGDGESQNSQYTIPIATTGYLLGATMTIDAAITCDFELWRYDGASDVATGFVGGKRLFREWSGVTNRLEWKPPAPVLIPALTDLWWRATPSATAQPTVSYSLMLVDD